MLEEAIRLLASVVCFVAMGLQIRLLVRHYVNIDVWVRRILVPYTVMLLVGVIGIVEHLRDGSNLTWATFALVPVFTWLALALALARPAERAAR